MSLKTDDLKSALDTEIETIADPVQKAKAKLLNEEYANTLAALSGLRKKTLDSYSLGGRTINRRPIRDAEAAANRLENQLKRLIYGNVTLVDMNAGTAQA